MILAETLPPLQLTATFRKRCVNHDQETANKKKLKTSNGTGTDVVDRAVMLKLRYSDIILKAQHYTHAHGVNKLQEENPHQHQDEDRVRSRRRVQHQDEDKARSRRVQLEAQRKASRLELQNMEKNVLLHQDEDKARSRRVQLEAQRKASRLELENMEKNAILQVEDSFKTFKELEKLAGCSFSSVIHPLEKIGLRLKDDYYVDQEGDKTQDDARKLQENPHYYYEEENDKTARTRSRRLQLESQRKAARLELQNIENTADIEDNIWSLKQLQQLAGCSLGFVIDPCVDDDAAAKVTMGAFQGTRFWNPLHKFGVHIKD